MNKYIGAWCNIEWKVKSDTFSGAFKEAIDITAKAIKRHETRMKKYGTLGY